MVIGESEITFEKHYDKAVLLQCDILGHRLPASPDPYSIILDLPLFTRLEMS